ncbi:hypothetical protein Taro_021950 [Colocasia esculenta]|uniref:Uncharacterized protein n=1 Tax=Colocasia esculenta TaxID=4460 RepID=A0A843V2M0_COLES|nr:hypothetical protein [Colocasia esculenta]
MCSGKVSSVDTRSTSVDTLSQFGQKFVLGRSLLSTLVDLVSTHCPKLAQKFSGRVVMRNQRSRMGQGKSDEHPPYE